MFTLERIRPVANSISDGTPIPTARVSGVRACSTAAISWSTSLSLAGELGVLEVRLAELAGLQRRAGDLGAADVDADELVAHRPAAARSTYTVTGRTCAASKS